MPVFCYQRCQSPGGKSMLLSFFGKTCKLAAIENNIFRAHVLNYIFIVCLWSKYMRGKERAEKAVNCSTIPQHNKGVPYHCLVKKLG